MFASNGRANPAKGLRHGIGGLLADAIELIELQVSLFKLNAHQAKQKALLPVALLSIGSVLALAAMPLLLVAIAYLVADLAEWPVWAGFGVTFLVAVLLGGLAAYLAFRSLISVTGEFEDTSNELSRNMTWLKSSLRSETPEQTERERYNAELKTQMESQWDRSN